MLIFGSLHQATINLPSTNWVSLQVVPLAGVWKDALWQPVKMSQVFTTPDESLEIATPSLTCRLTDSIEDGVGGVDIVQVMPWSAGGVPVSQNLTVWSLDAEMM